MVLQKLNSWLENNREKIMTHIDSLVKQDEKLLVRTYGHTAPPEWMDRLPIVDAYYKLNKKNYFLVLTTQRFIALQIKGWSLDVVHTQEWDNKLISSITCIKHKLSSDLQLLLIDGNKLIYKETEQDEAIGMEHSFKNLL